MDLDPASVMVVDDMDAAPLATPHPFKHMFRRAKDLENAWWRGEPKKLTFVGHPTSVVTCLQFDDEKIVSGSDDQTI
ncbi:SCF ubiquitin ligase complex subunit cdc4 [Allomyces arbusculus]|nr:SCF ubiquitin ligase complex subunit cdc4 [Allomyces arbusculus]